MIDTSYPQKLDKNDTSYFKNEGLGCVVPNRKNRRKFQKYGYINSNGQIRRLETEQEEQRRNKKNQFKSYIKNITKKR